MNLLFIFIPFLFSDDCEKLSGFKSTFPYSFYVYDLSSKKEVSSCHKDLLLIPASSLKVLTSVYAFEMLGKDFRFKTDIALLDKDGEQAGMLVIKAGGDFTLGSENFSSSYRDIALRILNSVKNAGVRRIGKLVLQNIYLSFPDGSVEWQDLGNYYATSVSFFSINDNLYKIYLQSFQQGRAVKLLKIEPEVGLQFINEVYSGAVGSGDNAYIWATPYSSYAFISGTIPPLKEEFVIKGALFRPDLFFIEYLSRFMKENGVDIDKWEISTKEVDIKDGVVIDTIYSPALSEIIAFMNRKSFNLYADSLFHFALIKKNKLGVDFNKDELSRFLKSNGIENFYIVDGSGLSRRNLFSSQGFVKILSLAYNSSYFEEFYLSLVSGYDTNVSERRYLKVKGADEVRYKSGSMSRVRSWCGYLKKKNKIYAFSFIFNNYLDEPSTLQRLVEEYLSKLID